MNPILTAIYRKNFLRIIVNDFYYLKTKFTFISYNK